MHPDINQSQSHGSDRISSEKPGGVQATAGIVIPARLNSTRLPRKLLLSDTGKTVIQHTYEAASLAKRSRYVVVATDSDELFVAVQRFGGNVLLTDANHKTGSDRVAEIASNRTDMDIVCNVQGDEPEISGSAIDMAIEILDENPEVAMSTLATPIRSMEKLLDPACVKIVFDQRHRALYFSRASIPYSREGAPPGLDSSPPCFFQHIGVYAYRRDFLLQFSSLPRSQIEECENLEQLRVLHAGFQIGVGITDYHGKGIDTPKDYKEFVDRWRGQHHAC